MWQFKYPRSYEIRIGDEVYSVDAYAKTSLLDDNLQTIMAKYNKRVVEDMMQKRRRPFVVEDYIGTLLAMGVLYDDGNVQVLWRISLGWTGEQYHSIAQMLGIEEDACTIRLVPELPEVD